MHWPIAWKNNGKKGPEKLAKNADGSTPLDNGLHPTTTWMAMEDLVKKGLVRNIGVSNFNSKQIEDIIKKGNVSQYCDVLINLRVSKMFYKN